MTDQRLIPSGYFYMTTSHAAVRRGDWQMHKGGLIPPAKFPSPCTPLNSHTPKEVLAHYPASLGKAGRRCSDTLSWYRRPGMKVLGASNPFKTPLLPLLMLRVTGLGNVLWHDIWAAHMLSISVSVCWPCPFVLRRFYLVGVVVAGGP